MRPIFEYTSYQQYLRDFFKESKKKNPGFSHRFLAAKLGIAMPNLILLITQGKRKMSAPLSSRFARFLRFNKRETLYFESMAGFLNAKTHEQKNTYFQQMLRLRRNLKMKKIEERQYEYYSNWYNLVVRELVTYPQFKGNFKWLAKKIIPPITPEQAKASVRLLWRLGLIKRAGRRYKQQDAIVSTGPEVNSLAVVNFHRAMACLAAGSYDRIPKNEHNITSCTVNLSKEAFDHLIGQIADFRKRVMAMAGEAKPASRVYQMNFQLFPVSKE